MQYCTVYALLQVFLISYLLTATCLMKVLTVSKVTQLLCYSPLECYFHSLIKISPLSLSTQKNQKKHIIYPTF